MEMAVLQLPPSASASHCKHANLAQFSLKGLHRNNNCHFRVLRLLAQIPLGAIRHKNPKSEHTHTHTNARAHLVALLNFGLLGSRLRPRQTGGRARACQVRKLCFPVPLRTTPCNYILASITFACPGVRAKTITMI